MCKITPSGAGDHIDADTLAALAGKALGKQELPSIFAHLAACERCRDCLRIAAQAADFHWAHVNAPQRTAVRRRPPRVFFRAAAGIACSAAALWLVTPRRSIQIPTATFEPHGKIANVAHFPLAAGTLRFVSELNSPGPPFGLPGPWAAARLNSAVHFRPMSGPMPVNNQISVKTALGERWIALDLSGRSRAAAR